MKKINKTLLLASTLFVSSAVGLADKSYADEGYDLNVEPSNSTNLDTNETKENTEENNLNTPEASENESSSIFNEENEPVETYDSLNETPSLTPQENTTDLNNQQVDEQKAELNQQEVEANEAKSDLEENNEADSSLEDSQADVNEDNQDEDLSNEDNDDLIYYDNKNLDEIFNSDYNSKKSTGKDLENKENASYKNEKDEEDEDKDSNVDSSQKEDDKDSDDSTEEETNLEKKDYYSQKNSAYLVNEKGTTRYYEDNKLVKNARVIVEDKFYEIDEKGNATNPKAIWSSLNNNIYYINEDGNISKGIREVNGNKYYFNKDGQLQRNKIIATNKSYYVVANDGSMTSPKNKWATINNNKYYNDNNGKLLKGIATIDNKSYYFDNNGKLATNKKIIAADKYYIVDNKGVAKNPKNSWFAIAGKTYRSDENGKLAKGARTINNNTYVFDTNGIMQQNKSVISAGKFYSIDNRGVATVAKNSWVQLDGRKYHTNANGYVKEGVWKIDNQYYYFTQNGLTPNKTITQKGIVYTVDQNGVATREDNNVAGQKSIDKALEWMFNARDSRMTYNMGAGRNTASQADCSSAVYRSLIYGGFLSQDAWVGNTETLFQMGAKGSVMYEVSANELQYGDIFVSGRPGGSAGAAGHTGFILNPLEDTIIHMTYSKNGVAVTPRKGYMGDSRGLPVRYYRLVGASSNGTYLNRK